MSSFSTVPSMVSVAPSSVAMNVNVFFDTLPLLIGIGLSLTIERAGQGLILLDQVQGQAHAVGCLSLPAAGERGLRAGLGVRHDAEQQH